MFFFFFSSRRRHTRFDCDWSSDVCSSDLAVRTSWSRRLLIAVFGVAIGATASWISGELAISWIYVLIDTAQVVGASVLTGILVTVWLRRRRARPAAR